MGFYKSLIYMTHSCGNVWNKEDSWGQRKKRAAMVIRLEMLIKPFSKEYGLHWSPVRQIIRKWRKVNTMVLERTEKKKSSLFCFKPLRMTENLHQHIVYLPSSGQPTGKLQEQDVCGLQEWVIRRTLNTKLLILKAKVLVLVICLHIYVKLDKSE